MNTFLHNLVSGGSYLTENSSQPEIDGRIIYNNLTAVAETLFGAEYTDEDMGFLIDCASNGTINNYDDPNMDATAAVAAVAARIGR